MSKKKERPNKRVENSIPRNEKIGDMTRKQFEELPYRGNWNTEVICDCIILLPSRKMHESGYRMMDFVAVKNGKPLCKLSGCSDVLHIEGIGGGGLKVISDKPSNYNDLVERKAWSMDCLRKSGLLRMWAINCDIVCGNALSSFEIYSKKEVICHD